MKKINQASVLNLTKSLVSIDSKSLLWTASLLTLAVIAPAILAHTPQNQWLTGTIVNLILFTAALKLSPANALLIAIVPSSIALMRGLLPAPMATVLPFIIASNFLLIVVFQIFRKFKENQLVLGVITASLAKFAFLFGTTLIFAKIINSNLIFMLQWSQLATALAGGFVFAGAVNFITKKNKRV